MDYDDQTLVDSTTTADSDGIAPPVIHPDSEGEQQEHEAADTAVATKERRPRGFLEASIKSVLDDAQAGRILPAPAALTPHYIGKIIKDREGLDEAPSTGAISSCLKRWVEIGFITASDKPFAFTGYTPESAQGLEALKAAAKAAKNAG